MADNIKKSEEEQASVPYFVHEGVISHMEQANELIGQAHKHMLQALLAVCVTLIIAVGIFVTGYVINNKDWIRYAEKLRTEYSEPSIGGNVQQSAESGD